MIFVSRAIPINEPGAARLDRAAVWEGLVRKANNALPFVPVMSECTVVARYSETCFDRDIRIGGEEFRERVTLEQPHRVVFTRLSGTGSGHDRQRDRGPGQGSAAALQLCPGAQRCARKLRG